MDKTLKLVNDICDELRSGEKTATQLVYQFCKLAGICTQCNVKFTDTINSLCEKCRTNHNNNRRKNYKNNKIKRS